MRKVMAIAALGLIVCSTAATAQGGGGRRGGFGQGGGMFGGGGGLGLLRIKEVQTELKMTEPQVAKVDTAQQAMMQKMQELRPQGGGGGGAGGGGFNREEMQALMTKMQELQTKAVADILDTTQVKRLKQLEIQQQGANALVQKSVSDELKLTADQTTKIRDMQQASRQEMMESFRNSGVDLQNATPEERQAFMKKIQDSQKAAGEKLLTVLTDAQKTQFKAMQGAAFKFPENMGFGRGGPGGGRRPGGNPPPAA